MKAWMDFVPDIAPFLTDCPAFTIADTAKAETIDYFRETRIWRTAAAIAIATSVAGQSTYAVSNTAGQELVGLVTVWQDGLEIDEAVPGKARDYDLDETGPVKFALLVDGATVQLLPTPDTSGRVIKAVVAYAPTDAAIGISDALYALYGRTLRDRVLARLKTMQSKPWSDPNGAQGDDHSRMASTLYDSTMAGPTARNRLRTKKSVI